MRKGPVRVRSDWDRLVNDQYGGANAVLSDKDSVRLAKALYYKAMGKGWSGRTKVVRGNRHTWVVDGVLCVNPNRDAGDGGGVRGIVHMMSHYCHRRLHPKDAPHSSRELYIERDLTAYTIAKGWLERGT